MKRIVESPLSYKITFVPVKSLVIGGLMLAVFGTVFFNLLTLARLHCQRLEPEQVRCERATAFLGIHSLETVRTIDLDSAEGASIKTTTNSKGQKSYYVMLQDRQGETIALTQSRSDFVETQRIQNEINGFLQFHVEQPQLDVEEHIPAWSMSFVGFFMLIPLLMVFTGSIDTLEIDLAQRQFNLTRKQVWRTRRDEIPFVHLARVRVQEQRGSKGSKSYRLWLHLSDGSAIDIGREESCSTLEELQTRLERYM